MLYPVGTIPGCRPNIVIGPKGSMIQPVNGWRARVALIVDRGTCDANDEFVWVFSSIDGFYARPNLNNACMLIILNDQYWMPYLGHLLLILLIDVSDQSEKCPNFKWSFSKAITLGNLIIFAFNLQFYCLLTYVHKQIIFFQKRSKVWEYSYYVFVMVLWYLKNQTVSEVGIAVRLYNRYIAQH